MSGSDATLACPPWVGFGTWMLGRSAHRLVGEAIEMGYRHIDSAPGYGNEAEVGAAIRDSGVPRSSLYVTAKLPAEARRYEREQIRSSLRLLQMDAVDLYLIHGPPWPGVVSAWEALVLAQSEGLATSVGVSNFMPGEIDALARAVGVVPEFDQIPFGPRLYVPGLADALSARGVSVIAHSPLSENNLGDPVLLALAERHRMSVVDLILCWHLAHRIPYVVRSTDTRHMRANLAVRSGVLSRYEITEIDSLSIVGGLHVF